MLPPHPELKQVVSWIPNDPVSEFDQQYRIERLGNGIALPNIQSCTEFPIYVQSWPVIDTAKLSDYEVHAHMGYPVEVHMQRGLTYDPLSHHRWSLKDFDVYPNVYRASKIMDSDGVVFDLDDYSIDQVVGEVQHRINHNYVFYHYLKRQQVIVPVVVVGHTIDDVDSQAYFEFVRQEDYTQFAGRLSHALGKVLAPEYFNHPKPNPLKHCTAEAMTRLTRTIGENPNMEMWGRMSKRNTAPTPIDQYIEIKTSNGDEKSPYGVCSIKATPSNEFRDSPLGVYFKANTEVELEERISESHSILELELRKILPELTPLNRREREIKTRGYITANPYFRKLYEVVRDHLDWYETMRATDTTQPTQEKELPVFSSNLPRLSDEQRFRVFEAGRQNQIQAPVTVHQNNVPYNGLFVPYLQDPALQDGVKVCQGIFTIDNQRHEYIVPCSVYTDALIRQGYHTQLGITAMAVGTQTQVAFGNRGRQSAPVNDGLSEADMLALWGSSDEQTPAPMPAPHPTVSTQRAPAAQPATPFDDMESYMPAMSVVANDLAQATADLREHLMKGAPNIQSGIPIYKPVAESFTNFTVLAQGNEMWATKVNRLVVSQTPEQGLRVFAVSHDNLAVMLPVLRSEEEALKVITPWCGLIMNNRKKAFYDKLRHEAPKPTKIDQEWLLGSMFGFSEPVSEVPKAAEVKPTHLSASIEAQPTAQVVPAPTVTQERRRSLLTEASTSQEVVQPPAPRPQAPEQVEAVDVEEEKEDHAVQIDFSQDAALVQRVGNLYAFGGYLVDLNEYIKSMTAAWVTDAGDVKAFLRDVIQSLKSGRFDLLPVGATFPQKVTDACTATGVHKVDLAPWCFARQKPVTELDPKEVHSVKSYFLFIRDRIKVANTTGTVTGAPALLGMAQAEFDKLKPAVMEETPVTPVVDDAALNAKMMEAAEKLDRTTFVFGTGVEPVLRTPEHPLTVRRLAAAMLNLHPTAVAFASLEEMPDTPTAKKWAQVIRKARSIIRETGAAGSRVIETYGDDNLTVVGSPWVDDLEHDEWVSIVQEECMNLFGDIGWIRPTFSEAMVDTIAITRVMDLAEVRSELDDRVKAIIATKHQIIDMATQIDDLQSRTTAQTYRLQAGAGCVTCVARDLPLASDRRQTAGKVVVVDELGDQKEGVSADPLVQITLYFEEDNPVDLALKKIDADNTDIGKLSIVEELDEWVVPAFPSPELSYVNALGVTLTAEDLNDDENIDVIDTLTPVKTFIPTVYAPVGADQIHNALPQDNPVNVECVVEYKAFDDSGALLAYIKDYKERVRNSEYGLFSEYVQLLREDLQACDGDTTTSTGHGWTSLEVVRFARLITNAVNEHLRVALGLATYIPDVLTCESSTYKNIEDGVLAFDICGAGLMVNILEDMTKRESDADRLDEPANASIVSETVFYVHTTRLGNNIGVRNVGRQGKLIKPDECGEFINTLIKALEFAFAGVATTPPVKIFTGCGNMYTIRNHNHGWLIAMG